MKKGENIGRFFKNRLERESSTEDSWFRPKEEIKKQILQDASVTSVVSTSLPASGTPWLLLLSLAAVAGMALFSFNSYSNNNELEQEIQSLKSELKLSTDLVNQADFELISENKKLEDLHSKIQELEQELTTQHNFLATSARQSKMVLAQNSHLEKELSELQRRKELASQTINIKETKKSMIPRTSGKETSSDLETSFLHTQSNLRAKSMRSEKHLMPLITLLKSEKSVKRKLALSLTAGLYNFRNTSETIVAGKRTSELKAVAEKARQYGLGLDYQLHRNWGLSLGLVYAQFDINSSIDYKFNYIKDREYVTDKNTLAYDIDIVNRTNFYETMTNEKLIIPTDFDIKDDAALQFIAKSVQSIRYYQFPLSIYYNREVKKLNLRAFAGLQYGRFILWDHKLFREIQYKDRSLSSLRAGTRELAKEIKHVYSPLVGIGLSYPLTDFTELGLSANVQYDLDNTIISTNSRPLASNLNLVLRVTINN